MVIERNQMSKDDEPESWYSIDFDTDNFGLDEEVPGDVSLDEWTPSKTFPVFDALLLFWIILVIACFALLSPVVGLLPIMESNIYTSIIAVVFFLLIIGVATVAWRKASIVRFRVAAELDRLHTLGLQDYFKDDFDKKLNGYDTLIYAFDQMGLMARGSEKVTGNTVRDALDTYHVERYLSKMSSLYMYAYVLGFIGTLVGIVIQVLIAQSLAGQGVFSLSFLNGMMLSVVTTAQGVLAASYNRWVALNSEVRLNELSKQIVDYSRKETFRRLNNPKYQRVAMLKETTKTVMDGFERTTRESLEKFETVLAAAIKDAGETSRDIIENAMCGAVTTALEPINDKAGEIGQKFSSATEKLLDVHKTETEQYINALLSSIQEARKVHGKTAETIKMTVIQLSAAIKVMMDNPTILDEQVSAMTAKLALFVEELQNETQTVQEMNAAFGENIAHVLASVSAAPPPPPVSNLSISEAAEIVVQNREIAEKIEKVCEVLKART